MEPVLLLEHAVMIGINRHTVANSLNNLTLVRRLSIYVLC